MPFWGLSNFSPAPPPIGKSNKRPLPIHVAHDKSTEYEKEIHHQIRVVQQPGGFVRDERILKLHDVHVENDRQHRCNAPERG